MKKSLTFVLVTSMFLFTLGCRKDRVMTSEPENTPTSPTTMSADSLIYLSTDGYLVFATRDIYENTIQNLKIMSDNDRDLWEQNLGYTSCYRQFYDAVGDSLRLSDNTGTINKNSSLRDLLFARLINGAGMIQIENTIYRVLGDSMLIYTLNMQNYDNHYQDFLNGNFKLNYMNRLSGDFFGNIGSGGNFFDYIDMHASKISAPYLNPFIRTSGAIAGPVTVAPGGSIHFRAKAEAYYNNYGIYRSVKCTFHYQAKGFGFWVPKKTDVKIHWDGSELDTRCVVVLKNNNNNTSHFAPAFSLYSNYHDENRLKWTAYSGSKAVKSGDAFTTFVYKDKASGQYQSISTNILTFQP